MTRIVVLAILLTSAASACNFTFEPAALTRNYRADGWALPGIKDYNPHAPVRYWGAYPGANIANARAFVLAHDEDPYIIEIPAQTLVANGENKRLRPLLARAYILRWEMDGKIFAYSYGLIPVDAHRENNKWKIDSEVGCTFPVTFIDEVGDGVFRLMVQSALTESLVPAWVKKPEAD